MTPRTFQIRSGSKSQRTPAPLLVTKRGQLPNLPMQLARQAIPPGDTLLLSFPLYDWYMSNPNANKQMLDLFSTLSTSLAEFTGQTEAISFLSARAPGSTHTLCDNAGKSTAVRVCEGTGIKVTQEGVAKLHRILRTDFVLAPTDAAFVDKNNSGQGAKRRRAERSIQQVKEFTQCVLDEFKQDGGVTALSNVFASVQGGTGTLEQRPNVTVNVKEAKTNDVTKNGVAATDPSSIIGRKNLREECATNIVEIMHKTISENGSNLENGISVSISIDGLFGGESPEERQEAIKSVLNVSEKQSQKGARLLTGSTGAPWEVLHAVKLGIDLIDSSFPFDMAEYGYATQLSFNRDYVNLRDRKWETNAKPIVEGCPCFACTGFCRAYIRHLLEVHEMMGVTLLAAHNLWDYLTWFSQLRKSVDDGSFQKFVQLYEERRRSDIYEDTGN